MLKLALVGCGGMANWHASQLKAIPQCAVVAVCDTVPAQTAAFVEKYFPAAKQFADYDAMLAAGGIDGVVLVTPHTLHYPQAKAALERGLHVLVEKPMVTSSAHAYDLWRLSEAKKLKLGITFQSPYSAEFGYLAAWRNAGGWGKVQMISGWLSQSWLKGTAGKWRQQPELSGGGQMYDSGAHLLNALVWLLAEPVVNVACYYDTCGSPVDINGVVIARFQSGALASVTIGGNCPVFRTEIQIQTDKYLILTDQYGGKLEVYADGGKRVYPHVQQNLADPAAGSPHRNFVDAVLGTDTLKAGARYGVLLSALMDAMYESADKKRPVDVAPVPASIA